MKIAMKIRSSSPDVRDGLDLHHEHSMRQHKVKTWLGASLRGVAPIVLVAMLGALSGCSSSGVGKPVMGAISFTDSGGNAQPAITSLAVGTGTYLEVATSNDPQLLGADWSVSCGSALPPGSPLPPGYIVDPSCGTFTLLHTLGGPVPSYAGNAAPYLTYYTAPAGSVKGDTVTLYASSSIDPSSFSSVTLTITGGTTPTAISGPGSNAGKAANAMAVTTTTSSSFISGKVSAGLKAVSGASVSLYAATSSELASSAATANSASVVTDNNGNFSIPSGYACPAPSAQMYLVSTGGSNSRLTLMAALGSCSSLGGTKVVVNEATTIASAYALADVATDALHIGSGSTSPSALAYAFSTANALVDVSTGAVRATTPVGDGAVSKTKIDTLANMLSACALQSSACDRLFAATNTGATPANTLQAALNLVHHAGDASHVRELYDLAASAPEFQPVLNQVPDNWTLGINFAVAPGGLVFNGNVATDNAGNIWTRDIGSSVTEFIGASSYGEHWQALPVTPGWPSEAP